MLQQARDLALAASILTLAACVESGDEPRYVSGYTQEEQCRAVISTVMGRDPLIIHEEPSSESHLILWYFSPTDGSRQGFKCTVWLNGIARWGNDDGRWRDDPSDGKVKLTMTDDDDLKVTERYSDYSETRRVYTHEQLKSPQ